MKQFQTPAKRFRLSIFLVYLLLNHPLYRVIRFKIPATWLYFKTPAIISGFIAEFNLLLLF